MLLLIKCDYTVCLSVDEKGEDEHVSRMFVSKRSQNDIISPNLPSFPCHQRMSFLVHLGRFSSRWLMSVFIREEPHDISWICIIVTFHYKVSMISWFFFSLGCFWRHWTWTEQNPYFIKLGYVFARWIDL